MVPVQQFEGFVTSVTSFEAGTHGGRDEVRKYLQFVSIRVLSDHNCHEVLEYFLPILVLLLRV